jgi:hypothetical protein
MHHAASGTMGSVLPLAAFAPRQKWIVTLSVCFLRTRPFSLQVQRMSANRPLWQNKTRKLEVLGPSEAFSTQGKCAPRWLRYQHDIEGLLLRFLLLL